MWLEPRLSHWPTVTGQPLAPRLGMKRLLLLCVVGSLFVVPSVGAKAPVPVKVSDPAMAMKVLYTMSMPISARLNALMALDAREAHGEVGRLGAG